MAKMTDKEITQFVNYYIGVERYGGLRGISDMEHLHEFYYVDCDLEIEPSVDGSLADEFEEILRRQSPQNQARILRAGLQEFFVWSQNELPTRQEKLRPRLKEVALRLESESTIVENVSPQSPSESVRLALEEAEDLIRRGRVPSAVDRTHTALHAYIKDLCDDWTIEYEKDASLTKVFKVLRKNHPAFSVDGPRQQEIEQMLNGLATVLDGLNPIRNWASLAHRPDTTLLEEAEATFAINAARSIFHYIEDKMQELYDEADRALSYSTVDDSPPSSVDDIPF